jgi:hypothetical protein
MSRTEHFYHGTNVALNPGDLITPANSRGGKTIRTSGYHDVGAHAYAMPGETKAWEYAFDSSNRLPGNNKDLVGKQMQRPRVYAVEPVGEPEKGPEHHSIVHPEYVAPAWRIKHELHAPRMAQGALPNLNWNQFRTDDRSETHSDANNQLAHLREMDRRKAESEPQPHPEHPKVRGQQTLF